MICEKVKPFGGQMECIHPEEQKCKKFRIGGKGIYSINQPRYSTAKEAHDDLWRYAKSREQSPLLFSVYEDLPDGSFRLA